MTVHGRGYRFVPPVTSRDAVAISAASPDLAAPSRAPAHSPIGSRLPRLAIAGVLALAIIGGVVAARITRDKAPDAAAQPLLAVLPFKPLAATDRNESLELGMAETLIMALNAESLTVAPLSSVRRYAAIETDALAAGRELGADAVLEGSIQRDREELRVSARLLEVDTGRQLWAERFDLRFTDIFAVQDAIAGRVRAALLPEATAASGPARHMTADAEAYQLYANGRYHRQQRVSEAGLREALGYFEAAVARDPNFALAYVGLAEAHSILGAIAIVAPQEAFPKALVAVERALSIAPDLGEAYASLGHIKQQYEQDWAGAERAHRRAVELAPSYAPAQQWYGHYLAYAGQIDEGLEQIRKAQALEPTAPSYSALIGMFLNYQRRYEEAIEQLQRTLEMDEHFAIAHTYLGVAYLRLGRFDEAARHFDKPVVGTLGTTTFTTSGGVIRHEADRRKTVSLNVDMPSGNLPDLLTLAMKGETFMEGQIALKTKIDIPPLSGKVREKLLLDGEFEITKGKFLRSTIQDQIDMLSRRGQGQPQNMAIDEVVLAMGGRFRMEDEKITFDSLSFAVPGSGVDLSGTFDVAADMLDFHGTLKLDAKVSQTMTGWKRWVLKPVDPFFSKQGAGTFLRIQVVGSAKKPQFGRDKGPKDEP